MLMKKFLGATAREAMQKMKAEMGADALVISNRKTNAGVEIMAMVESAHEMAQQSAAPIAQVATASAGAAAERRAPARAQTAASPSRGPAAPARSGLFTSLKDFAERIEAPPPRQAQQGQQFNQGMPLQGAGWQAANAYGAHDQAGNWAGGHALGKPGAREEHDFQPRQPAATRQERAPATVPSAQTAPEPTPTEQRMFEELSAMKAMLQSQIAGLAWRDMAERKPLALKIWRELIDAGFSASLARAVADKLPDDHSEAQARKWLAEVLARNIRCADPAHDMVESGGVFALVGPTGVGKTTTTAKLAARCVVKFGAQSLGLITTDSYRIGAFDQLAIYGKILGVPVHSAQSYGELEATIATMAGKRLVLIDTTGMGQRDNRVAEQINLLNNPRIKRVLLLNAAAQAETLDDVARAYQGRAAGARPLAGAILTKIDEAAKLAPALDVVARHGLELLHLTNGQRVPEDLHAPTSAALVHRALKAATDPVYALNENEVAARAVQSMQGMPAAQAAAWGAFNA